MKNKLPAKYVFIAVWLALMALLFIMFGLAHFDLGRVGTAVILMLAFVQMLLVMFFFMRLREGTRLVRLFSAAGFCWLLFLFILIFSDYLTRQWH